MQGGAAIVLGNLPTGFGGSWGEDGNIIAAPLSGPLVRIPSAGGVPAPVTELAQGEVSHRWPQVLPGSRAVLFSAYTATAGLDGASIEVMSLGDRRRKTLQRGGAWGRYLPSGHFVYLNSGTLFAALFDLDRLEVRGTPVPVLGEVAYNTAYGAAQLDFSRTGTVVYRSGGAGSGLMTVQWLDSAGKTQPLLVKPGDYLAPYLSPDGNRMALGSAGDMWVYDWRRDTMMRLTSDGGHSNPVWSPDGRYIVFRAQEGMFWTRADGAGKPQPLTHSTKMHVPWSFTADGKRLAFSDVPPEGGFDLGTLSLESDGAGLRAGKPEVFLKTSFDERNGSFSPDGRWLAYASDDSGAFQVYVRAFPDQGGKWQISNSGGVVPVWSRNGRELFFRTVENQIMVAAYTVKGDSFLADKPRLWSEKRLANVGFVRNYDVAPDGKHIAVLLPAEGAEGQKAQNHVIFLLNFFDEVRRRVAAGGN